MEHSLRERITDQGDKEIVPQDDSVETPEIEAGEAQGPQVLPKKLTKSGLSKYLQKQLFTNLPALAEALYPALLQSVRKREPWAIKMSAEILGIAKGDQGVTVNVSQNVQNNLNVDSQDRKSYSQLVRNLELRDEMDRLSTSPTIEVNPQ
jgi:hypothetical protein